MKEDKLTKQKRTFVADLAMKKRIEVKEAIKNSIVLERELLNIFNKHFCEPCRDNIHLADSVLRGHTPIEHYLERKARHDTWLKQLVGTIDAGITQKEETNEIM